MKRQLLFPLYHSRLLPKRDKAYVPDVMKAILLFPLLFLPLLAEVEYELHTSHSSSIVMRERDGKLICCPGEDSRHFLPIVVSVTNEDHEPVKGAVAAIKRIEPDGYTEEDVRNTQDSATDRAGLVILHCPCGIDESDPKNHKLRILGAITVVADGYETTAIEFEQYYAGMEIPANERSALAAHIVLTKKSGLSR